VKSDIYEAPALKVLGEITELTAGTSSGTPDGTDGAGSTEPVSDIRLKRNVQGLLAKTESYEAPTLTVLGEVAELTEGAETGTPDQADGVGSTLNGGSDIRLKRDVQAL
jgi:hypothetical protein